MKTVPHSLLFAVGLLSLVQAENSNLHLHAVRPVDKYEVRDKQLSELNHLKHKHGGSSNMQSDNKGKMKAHHENGKETILTKAQTIMVTKSITIAAMRTGEIGTGEVGIWPTVTITPPAQTVTQMTAVTQTLSLSSQCAASVTSLIPIPAGSESPIAVAPSSVSPLFLPVVSVFTAPDPSVSTAPAAVGSPGAVAAGTGTLGSGGACECQCLCGTGSFSPSPAAAAQPAAGAPLAATTLQTIAASSAVAATTSTSIDAGIAIPAAVTSAAVGSVLSPSVASLSTSESLSPPVAASSSSISEASTTVSSASSTTAAAQALGVQPAAGTAEAASLDLGQLTVASTAAGTTISVGRPTTASEIAAGAVLPTEPPIDTAPVSITNGVEVNTAGLSSALVLGNLAAPASFVGL